MASIEITPKILKEELIRLARLDRHWFGWHHTGRVRDGQYKDKEYAGRCRIPATWIDRIWKSGADGFGMWATSIYYLDGPKVFRPSREQCAALSQIEVRLSLADFSQPYPTLLVQLPEPIGPFQQVLCFHSTEPDHSMLVCLIISDNNEHDITTTVAMDDRPIEVSLNHYAPDCASHEAFALRALRIALNSCLALVNYGCHKEYLYPKEVERDRRSVEKRGGDEVGERAAARIATAPSLVTFSREVVLHHTAHSSEPGESTGGEKGSHWRRGHWAMQPHGPHNSLRKRILRKPVLVRADKFLGDVSDTEVIYQ